MYVLINHEEKILKLLAHIFSSQPFLKISLHNNNISSIFLLCVHLNLFFFSPYSQYLFSPLPGPSSVFSDILIRKTLVGNSIKGTNYLLFGIQRKNWDQKISPQLAHPRLRFSLSLPTRAAQDVFCKCPSPLYLIAWVELL